jgi:hypothetical protein
VVDGSPGSVRRVPPPCCRAAASVGILLAVDGGQPVDDDDSLHRARQAYTAQDWSSAADSFDAVAPHRLTADDLAAVR